MPMARQHQDVIDRFLRTNASRLVDKLSASRLILKLYSSAVINKYEWDSLQAKKGAGWSERQVSELLLSFLYRKSFEQIRTFLELVGEDQDFLAQEVLEELAQLEGESATPRPARDRTHPIGKTCVQCVRACVCACVDLMVLCSKNWHNWTSTSTEKVQHQGLHVIARTQSVCVHGCVLA